jgi:putative transposase
MPWKETTPVLARMRFVTDYEAGEFGMEELAERYGISRKTGFKWMKRFREDGASGLEKRSRAAEHVANRTDRAVEGLVVEFRRQHPTWGPRKLLVCLAKRNPELELPARSTVAEILKRHGLSEGRKRRRKEGHPGRPRTIPVRPNDIWAMDFKGQFRTRDGIYCYPFTVTDLYSRYVIRCDGKLTTEREGVQASLEAAFREFGLPESIRSDNGPPFASTGIARLTRLGVWLLKLGIQRELIEPGRPDQNGCHERMHRTLKAETTRPAEATLGRQQKRFDLFVKEFNERRPHEALEMKCPAEVYRASDRRFPERVATPEYPAHFDVRLVSRNGGVKWKGGWLNVGHSLIEEPVGLEEVDDGIWSVHFANLLIGRFDERDLRLTGTLGTHHRCGKRGNRRRPRAVR